MSSRIDVQVTRSAVEVRLVRRRGAAVLVAVSVLVAGCGSPAPSTAGAAAGASGPPGPSSPSGSSAASGSSAKPSGAAGSGAGVSPNTSPTALDFTAPTVAGGSYDARKRVAGEPTVFWFWAPWCTVCRGEAGDIAEVATELKGKVTFVGIAGRGEVPEMQQFVADTKLGDLEHVVDADGDIWTGFDVVGQPSFAFVDGSGRIEVVDGAIELDELRTRARALAGA